MRTPGGTEGGIGTFLVGLGLTVAGGYLFTQTVRVTTGYGADFYGYNSLTLTLTLIPLLAGIGVLFFSSRSIVGWLLLLAGALIVLVGILLNLRIHWRQTSLFELLVMLVLLVGGLGLVARSLFPMGRRGGSAPA